MKSRGAGRMPVPLSVRGAVVARPAPPAVAEDAAAGCVRLIEAAPVDAPGAGAEADAGMVAGCFAQPLATRINSAVGTVSTPLID
jgi:hypothetical protein